MKRQLRTRAADFSTLVAILRERASSQPDKRIYTFLLDGEAEEAHLSYADVDLRARSIGAVLQNSMSAGERALLLYQPGVDYIAALFGCLYAGIVVVPTYLPDPARLERTLPRLHSIAVDSRPTVVLTTAAILPVASAIASQAPAFQTMRWLATDTIGADMSADWHEPDLNSASLAFLQYTSGSTATPKGVMLTHGNLLHNSALIAEGFGHTADSRGVIWLPPYHDMGLIGGILQPLYRGFPVTLLSPVAFLERPLRWLQAISRYRATTSGGPNFAYDLCVRKVTPEQRATLDLSSWTVAFNGAEPIRPDTIERFAQAFAPYGFRREAFYPCYGLAEATLIVTGGPDLAAPSGRLFSDAALGDHQVVVATAAQPDSRSLASCGRVLGDQSIAIVDPETLVRRPADTVGEIWVSGASVARGYWGQPAETARSFQAHLADSRQGPFLRTGDLGFVRDDQLFVTGRIKDLLIIRGRNHYPQDIELTVERCQAALRPGCGAVFSVEIDGEEQPVVVQEIDRRYRDPDTGALTSAIRQAVAEQHELRLHRVVLIKHGTIPKTSSGKIQRHACREAFLNGSLDVIADTLFGEVAVGDRLWNHGHADLTRAVPSAGAPEARGSQIEAALQSLVARTVGVDVTQVDPRQPLSALGLDSLMAIELKHAIETEVGVVVPLAGLLHDYSVARIAQDAFEQRSAGAVTVPIGATLAPAPSTVDHPLSYGQQAIWFLQQLAPESTPYSIVQAVRIRGYLNIAALQRALQRLVQRHAALRTTFSLRDGALVQHVHAHLAFTLRQADAVAWSEAYLDERLAQEAQRPFDLAHGPLLRADLFTRSVHEHILLLAVHHIVTDFWSLIVLARELDRLYVSETTGPEAALPALKAEYIDYVAWEAALLAGPEGQRLWAYWQRQLAGQLPILDLPLDRPRPPIQTYRGAAYPFTLSEQLSQRLMALAQAQGVTLYMTLLAAFQVLLHRYTGQDDILVGSPVAGRSRAAFAEVVGYFMNPVLMRADLSGNPAFALLLDRVRQVVLAALAHQEYPTHLLVERLQPSRDRSRSALFQVMFVLNRPHGAGRLGARPYEIGGSAAQLALGDLELSHVPFEQQAAQFDVTLTMTEAESLSASLEYNSDLFDATTIARFAGHFEALLTNIVVGPERPIRDLPLLTLAERRQLLVEWNGAPQGGARQLCMHHLVEAQAARTPDAIAVVFDRPTNDQRPTTNDRRSRMEDRGWKIEDRQPSILHPPSSILHPQSLTYRELNARANQLAHYLQRIGVGPEVRVALCLERSLDLIVGLLGVLKAGGAYVPLDPSYPAERIALIVESAGTAVLLCRRGSAPRLPQMAGAVVYLDTDWATIDQQSRENPPSAVTPQNLAYIIYTSGSTGGPKGVMIQHESLVSYIETAGKAYAISPADRVLQFASISFDTSNEEIYPCLAGGATLVLRTNAMLVSIAAFLKQCQEWGITVLDLPTSYWHELVDGLSKATQRLPPAIRLVIIGGERALAERRAAWHRHAGGRAQLLNTYGPTETTIVATMAEIATQGETQAPAGEVPIGHAIDSVQLYVLDRSCQLVPIGVPGQLFIGGAGLARGYLDSPALTAERFIPNPFQTLNDKRETRNEVPVNPDSAFSVQPLAFGERLYQTGDLVRYLPDGALEFLGRLDDQVKVRGFRVELGEIEAVLNQHAAVREAIVIARADATGPQWLVAYVVATNDQRPTTNDQRPGDKETRRQGDSDDATRNTQYETPSSLLHPPSSFVGELRAFLKQRLPEYMLPSAFVLLDALPLMPNGKVDRTALPAPGWTRAASSEPLVAPRTLVEELVAELWAEILGVEQVSIYDNFFEIGGHSLLAIKLIARLRDALQVELPLHNLFEMPTIAELAEQIAQAGQQSDRGAVLPIRPVPRDRPLPLSFSQEHLWFLDKLDPNSASYHVPRAIKLTGQLDIVLLERTFSELVRRHEILRTTFPTLDGRPIQAIHSPRPVSIPIIDLRLLATSQQEAQVQWLILADGQRPFDIEHGPLLRLHVFRLGDAEQVLLLTEHHLIHDGWTQGVLLREFILIYSALADQHPLPLPELPIQFADFAYWQREWLQGEVLEAQLSYWKQQLAGAPSVLDLPLDHPRPARYSSAGAEQVFVVPTRSAEALRALSRHEGCTLFMTMLAAFQVLLYRYSGQEDILVGSPVANRRQRETEGMLGMIINTVVLRTDLSGNPSFRALLQRVLATCLGAYAHQDLPFEKVVEAIQPKRSLSYNPLFQVMFGFQDTPTPELELPGLTLQLLDSHNRSAKFDLGIVVLPRVEQFTGQGAGSRESEIITHVEYNTDIFNPDTIERMIDHFQTLLLSAAADPDQRITDLPLLTEAERRQMLVEWNDNALVYTHDRCLHQLFAAQAERTPDAIAVVFDRPPTADQRPPAIRRQGDKQTRRQGDTGDATILHPPSSILGPRCLTYRELNRRANQLAHYLQRRGVGPESRVGICVEGSLALPIGLLSILKAGGAYVPLDPAYPQERLRVMLEETQVVALLTQHHLVERLPNMVAADRHPSTIDDGRPPPDRAASAPARSRNPHPDIVCIDSDWHLIAQERAADVASTATANNLAYVICTSGSTGTPKGVCCSHAGVINLLADFTRRQPLRPGDRCSLWTSISFDVSVYEIFSALLEGGALHIVPEAVRSDGPAFVAWLADQHIGSAYIPPFMLADLRIWAESQVQPVCLRRLLVGVEPIPEPLLATIAASIPGIRIINGYGPTETTICATLYDIPPEAAGERAAPIGRPVQNMHMYLLDSQLQPVPIGIPGELYIGGVGLARGYLGQPALTAERFVPNPFLKDEGGRMKDEEGRFILHPSSFILYRTGDLARYLPDGMLMFVGRRDQQVKLRGFRIELGEIEAVLVQHPAVREAVVAAREDTPGHRRLVAYIVAKVEDRGLKIEDRQPGASEMPSSILHPPSSILHELRAFLTQRLPEYMVPSAFVLLDVLPLTPNGKLDRRALPAPDWASFGQEHGYVAPRTPFEELLADLWMQVLGVERVGVYDNFFESGGHSLLATQLVARIRETFQVELPLRSLFESATIAELAQQIENLRRSGQRRQTLQGQRIIREGPLPTSFAQEPLWFIDQLGQNRSLYNMAGAVHISGPLKRIALAQAIDQTICRHEALRTTFTALDGRPSQVIAPTLMLNQPLVDLTALAAERREDQAQRLAAAEAQQPFDLSRGPLMRCTLLRLDEADHVLLLTTHHIVGDGWSVRVLMRDLSALYQACATGGHAPLPALPIQYADFASWQRRWMQGEVLQCQLDYWKERLGGSLPVLELPTDHPRPSIQTFRGGCRKLSLPQSLTASLKTLSRQEQATLFMTLLAAFQTLLARYTGQHDIVIGTPVANRTQLETEGLIGVFVNMLVLRTDLSGNPRFQALLKRVREVAVGAYMHQDLPFERLVEELQPERSLSHTPLVQVTFALQNLPTPTIELPELTWRLRDIDIGTAKFDLTLVFEDTGQGLIGEVRYSADLFEAASIDRLVGHVQTLLEAIVADPAQPIASLPLLTPGEREQVLVTWNATTTAYPHDRCLHQLIEAQIARTPDAIAVVFEGQQLSYRALNQRANHLARYLRQQGVGVEVCVGVYMERSLEIMVAILGILKAGGAYLPLDPGYPQARLTFMLEDAQVQLVVTQSSLLDRLPDVGLQHIYLDSLGDLPEDADDPVSGVRPDNLAYIIYTSGSTGKPKGVMIQHRSVLNLLAGLQRAIYSRYSHEPLAIGLNAPLTFDASVKQWLGLLMGHTLHLIPETARREGHRLLEYIEQARLNVLDCTPSLLDVLVREGFFEQISTTPMICLLGGEAIDEQLWQTLALSEAVHFYNVYGPTECTVDATICPPQSIAEAERPHIGRPIANVHIYLLDRQLRPLPIGVPGELYIGGLGLARGYLGRADLTAERFVPNPFDQRPTTNDQRPTTNDDKQTSRQADKQTSRPGNLQSPISNLQSHDSPQTQHSTLNTQNSRLYRTGDLARYLPDGNIEFLGRLDDQVKLRGFRIELGEIEAVLSRDPRVREAAVLAREDTPGDVRLVAYIVPKIEDGGWKIEDRQPDASETPSSILHPPSSSLSELRAFLKDKLPEYMLPSVFMLLDALPLTPSGKLDRRALPAPSPSQLEPGRGFVAPRTPIEELLAGIWANVLRVQQVGVYDNFFAQGGHSLLAAQVLSRIRQIFQVELPLRSLFEATTVAALAERVAAARQSRHAAPQLPAIEPVARDAAGGLPLSLAQQRLWVLDQFAPGNASYNIPFALRLRGQLVVSALRRSLDAIVRRHEVLRTTFAAVGDQPVQVIAPTLRIALPVIDLQIVRASDQPSQIERLMAAAAQQPFDLAQGPLLRAQLLRLGPCEHILLLTIHHITADGWSINILAREMIALYQAFSSGTQASLPELPVQYADFAVWQRTWLNDAAIEQQLGYWRRQLAGLPVLNLATDRPRPAVRSWRGASLPFVVDGELTGRLVALGQGEGATLFMTLLAAFQVLLFHRTGQEDMVVGTDVANRSHGEIEVLIGFFTNQLVLRTNLSGQPTFRELLARVRQVSLAAYTHQDMSFERLVQELNPQRSRNMTPLFQVKLVFQDDPAPVVQLPGLEAELLRPPDGMTKFDLTLFAWRTAGGLAGSLEYDRDLFADETMLRMLGDLKALLQRVVAEPDARLSALALPGDSERGQQLMERKTRARMQIQSLKSVRPKAVALPQGDLVKTELLGPGGLLPLVVQPATDEIDLADWAADRRDFLETTLLKHGAILFRGFGVDSAPAFERFALALCSELFKENAEHTPVTNNGNVQTPVFFPSDKQLLWHNENSFNYNWPMKLFFGCVQPAQQGGETTLVDSRLVFERIDARVREQFMQKQVMYVRNYGGGLGLPWQQVFRTTSRAEVEQRCQQAGFHSEWKDGDRLKTYCMRPAAIEHPRTGELTWFNQAQHWHIACLDPATRDTLLSMFEEADLPRQCYYGDGSRIDEAVMAEILEVYRGLEKSFPWQKGDVMMVDNLLTAHGRNPFVGERKILVALGAMSGYDEL